MLQAYLGDARLGDALKPVVVTSYDLASRRPVLFRTADARAGQWNPLMREVARATSAGPTFFPPVALSWEQQERFLIDGGVVANNPAVISYLEAETLLGEHERATPIVIVSLGTGHPTPEVHNDITLQLLDRENWLSLGLNRLLPALLEGPSQYQEDLLFRLLNEQGRGAFFRFQTLLGPAGPAMDDVREENIRALVQVGENLVSELSSEVDLVAQVLTASA